MVTLILPQFLRNQDSNEKKVCLTWKIDYGDLHAMNPLEERRAQQSTRDWCVQKQMMQMMMMMMQMMMMMNPMAGMRRRISISDDGADDEYSNH